MFYSIWFYVVSVDSILQMNKPEEKGEHGVFIFGLEVETYPFLSHAHIIALLIMISDSSKCKITGTAGVRETEVEAFLSIFFSFSQVQTKEGLYYYYWDTDKIWQLLKCHKIFLVYI